MEELLRKKVPLPSTAYDISFDIPTKEWEKDLPTSKQTVNLYLYDIKENRELRTNEWHVNRNPDGTVDQKKPPVRIDLSYLITAWSTAKTEQTVDEHRLLSMILITLFKYPSIPSDVLQEDLATINPPIEIPTSVAQPDGFKDQGQGQFWNAVDQFWKPGIHYVVTIPLDLQEKITGPMVTTRIAEYRFIIPVHVLSIQPMIQKEMPKDTLLMDVNVEATPVVSLDAPTLKNDDQITVNSVDGLSADDKDILMIVDGRKTEFCHIKVISGHKISVSKPLLFDHIKGAEIKRLTLSALLDVKLAAIGSTKSSELRVTGDDIRKLKIGGIIMVDNPDKIEYFQITGISGHEGSSETVVQLGGIVTNDIDPPAPIIGAKVTLVDSKDVPVDETFSDSEGKFTFKRLVGGKYVIKVSAQGYNGKAKTLEEITSARIEDLIIKLKST